MAKKLFYGLRFATLGVFSNIIGDCDTYCGKKKQPMRGQGSISTLKVSGAAEKTQDCSEREGEDKKNWLRSRLRKFVWIFVLAGQRLWIDGCPYKKRIEIDH